MTIPFNANYCYQCGNTTVTVFDFLYDNDMKCYALVWIPSHNCWEVVSVEELTPINNSKKYLNEEIT